MMPTVVLAALLLLCTSSLRPAAAAGKVKRCSQKPPSLATKARVCCPTYIPQCAFSNILLETLIVWGFGGVGKGGGGGEKGGLHLRAACRQRSGHLHNDKFSTFQAAKTGYSLLTHSPT